MSRDQAEQQSLALAAASQASEATTEMLRFAREGDNHRTPFGDIEVVEKLADALKMAMEVEHHSGPDSSVANEDRNQLYGAVARFLDGWAG